ncbi:MAG: peptide deformylase [Desulfobacterales bacterium]|nr:peptide deformylase [Desulfobacterales bacterium]
MPIRTIITFPDPLLRRKTEPVTDFDQSLEKLVADMAETMYDAPGVGLAANQIGVCRKLMLVDISEDRENKAEREYLVLANPEIMASEGAQIDEEGCLSVPDLTAKVKRFWKITLRAQDIKGRPLEFEAVDHFARVIQHEVDHLNGILFLDHLSVLKRSLYKKRRKKQLRQEKEAHGQ